ncbi:hypothetical protein D5086_016596 [Populus alba]|uniref:Uncharacterized protein n=1 Tax=Populus alba TaxID=43335 RepID=A0ACC4BVV2_POPAL
MQGGVAAPPDSLIWWELAGALAFEEENALAEGVMVIMATADDCMEREEYEEKKDYGPVDRHHVDGHYWMESGSRCKTCLTGSIRVTGQEISGRFA